MKVLITKLDEILNAKYPNSIPIGFTKEGPFLLKPEIGKPFYVGSYWRTSRVTEILGNNTFKTMNSIYKWELLEDGLTTDPTNPNLGHGVDEEKIPQHDVYLVLSPSERAKGFIRPVRHSYIHKTCKVVTTMGNALAETYARDPKFYGATYCCGCNKHLPVSEFLWDGTNEEVGS